jgi:hypothetical protein
MGRKKLLKKLAEFFDSDMRERGQRDNELADLLSRLKEKETEMKDRLESMSDPEEIKDLKKKIDIVHAQRKKGISMLKDVRNPDEEINT